MLTGTYTNTPGETPRDTPTDEIDKVCSVRF